MSILSRAMYFLYVLVAVVSRIVALEFVIITFGVDYFLCIYAFIGVHLFLVITMDIWFNWNKSSEKNMFWQLKSFIIRGFSSIYIYFPATEENDDKEEDLRCD